MVNFTVPVDLLTDKYNPENPSAQSTLFYLNNLEPEAIPPLSLDNITVWASDCFQAQKQLIDAVNADKIGVPGLQNQILYFSDTDTLSAINLGTLLSALPPINFDGGAIQGNTINGFSLKDHSISSSKYGLRSVTSDAIGYGEVRGANIKDNDIPLSKLETTLEDGILYSRYGSTLVDLLPMGDWLLPIKLPNEIIAPKPLDYIWDNAPVTYNGAKISLKSIPLSRLTSSNIGPSFLVGNGGLDAINELTVNNPNDRWKVPVLGHTNAIQLYNLTEIFSNSPGTFDGSKLGDGTVSGTKLAEGSVPLSKIQNISNLGPFASGLILDNATLNGSKNLSSVTSLSAGVFRINFTTPATQGYVVSALTGAPHTFASWLNPIANSVEIHMSTHAGIPISVPVFVSIWYI